MTDERKRRECIEELTITHELTDRDTQNMLKLIGKNEKNG